MDFARWHLWRGMDTFYALRVGTGGKVLLTARSEEERQRMCEEWEREHLET